MGGLFDPRRVRALLFDLGGVLIGIDFQRVFEHWARSSGGDATDIASRFSQDEAYRRHERGEIDASAYFSSLRSSLGIDLDDVAFLAGWNDLYLPPREGIAACLELAARSYPVFVFTNSNPSHQTAWEPMLRHELAHVRRVFVSSEMGRRKPDPEAFGHVAQEIGIEPEGVLFFDDAEENVRGAEAAGMQAVLVTSTKDVQDALDRLGLSEGG